MNKKYIKNLFFSIFFLLISYISAAQSITITSVDPGPYGQGSSITALIKIDNSTGCIEPGNKFELYLSDASGSFVNKTPPITSGNFNSFYTTFVNGIIPANTPTGNGYKIRVECTSPAIISPPSAAFTVSTQAGVTAQVSSIPIASAFPEVFGLCSGSAGAVFPFTNQSSANAATVTATFNDEINPGTPSKLNFPIAGPPQDFTATKTDHYTIVTRAVSSGGIVGTKAYFLVNNINYSDFNTAGIGTVCIPNVVTFPVPSGLQNNFPGMTYNIQWGDGTNSTYTICDFKGGTVSHSYVTSSCGRPPIQIGQDTIHNSFVLSISDVSPFCGQVGTPISTVVLAAVKPSNSFEIKGFKTTKGPKPTCTGSLVTFTNTSTLGQNPSQTSPKCSNNNMFYDWYVNGQQIGGDTQHDTPFSYTFAKKGNYIIKLTSHATAPINCPPSDFLDTICVQNAPKPSFTVEGKTDTLIRCASTTNPYNIIINNTSYIDTTGCQVNTYFWTLNGTNGLQRISTAKNPVFPSLTQAGGYRLVLTINTGTCGGISTHPQIIIINSAPTVALSRDSTFCGAGKFVFDNNPSPTQVIFGGSALTGSSPYKWTVTETGGTGGSSFADGTSDTSKYPHILFNDNSGIYTIKVTNSNTCGITASAQQVLTFQNAPIISAGGPYPALCPNTSVHLTGTISGPVQSVSWTSSGGGRFTSLTTDTTTYIPGGQDTIAGNVKLTFQALTTLHTPCNSISDNTTISINKTNKITSAPTSAICSGTALNYIINSTLPNSTFSWAVDPFHTSAKITGNKSGTGATIADVLNNTDTTYAIATYIITPFNQGCSGPPDTLKVTVAPAKPIASFTQDATSGCGPVPVNFTNTSTPYKSNYSWNFGDGNTSSSVNPSHTFQPAANGKDTTYMVTLQLITNCSTVAATSTVTVRPANPSAKFFPEKVSGCSPFILTVDNLSPDTNLSYHYYLYAIDGITLLQDTAVFNRQPVSFKPLNTPQHYIVYMVATNLCNVTAETPHIFITVSPPTVQARLQTENNESTSGCAPLNLVFENISLGGEKYYYNIYDSTKTTLIEQPIPATTANFPYSFAKPGTYYVSISAQNSCTALSESQKMEVDVYAVPKPVFTIDSAQACKSLTVNFTNLTLGSANIPASSLSYNWNFGDGTPHSYLYTPPPHTYHSNSKNLPYTVTLIATNPESCSDTVVKKDLINVYSPPIPDFVALPDSVIKIPNYHFDFEDKSTNSPVAWNWSFGDGKTSTLENPGHTYAYGDTGIHKITLIVYNKDLCDSTITRDVLITGTPGQLYLPNAFIPTGPADAIKTFLAKGSGIKTWHLQIFNNYGQLVWETTKLDSKGSPVESWDGTFKGVAAPQGAYIWQASATFINGSAWKGMSYNNSLPKRTGTVNLIR